MYFSTRFGKLKFYLCLKTRMATIYLLLLSIFAHLSPQAVKQPGLLMLIAVICVCWSSMNTFLYCYFGHLSTVSFLRIPDWLYASHWYELTNDQQRYYFMMIANSQRPLFFHGFGLANLTLETYSKV